MGKKRSTPRLLGALAVALGALIAFAFGQPLAGVLLLAVVWALVGSLLVDDRQSHRGRSWWRQCSR